MLFLISFFSTGILEDRTKAGQRGAQAKRPARRRFTSEDVKSSTLKIQITEVDEFTRECLSRQAANDGHQSIEEYIVDAAMALLESSENEILLDPQTGEVVLNCYELGTYIGWKVDRCGTSASSHWTRIPIPGGKIIETCT